MAQHEPQATIDQDFSSPGATPTPWAAAREQLAGAEVYWLTTVRPEGRPHVTPLIGIWLDGALHFCTGATERKAKNLVANPACVLTTGCNALGEGRDLVLEGAAARVRDGATLQRIADAYEAKYGSDWHFAVEGDGLLGNEGNLAQVYAVAPQTAFGFAKGEPFGQTRWRF